MDNLIDRIAQAAQDREDAKVIESQKKAEDFFSCIEKIKALGGRIAKMWDIAQALLNNGFGIGDRKSYWNGSYNELETEGWFHRLGFYVDYGRVTGFGVCGGGVYLESVFANRDGEVYINMNKAHYNTYSNTYATVWDYPHYREVMHYIIDNFDDYERKFYDYAERVADKKAV